jgi:ATP-binding cassette subfamily C protein CydD
LSTALVAVAVGVRLIEGWVTFGPAIAVLLLTPELYAPIRQLGQRRHAAMEAIVAAERLAPEVWSGAAKGRALRTRSIIGAGLTGSSQQAGVVFSRAITFEGISFRYPGAQSDALTAIDLELRPQTLTAIVGPSGAGKSTLVDLLLRFAAPTDGVIRSDGHDIADLDPRAWRQRIALMPQRPHFLDGTVLENLRVGRADASLADVRAAARHAAIDAFVMDLPHGYDTALGEMAGRASVGERQRLALARALVRDAPILVLDEPSSSLDPVTEATIARVIVDESRRRTVLVVAHRLRTATAADQLIVLNRGRIVERGRHDDLVQRDGLYARFVALVDPELEPAG